MSLTDVVSLKPAIWSDTWLPALAASIEEHAQHPVATSVVSAAKAQDVGHVEHCDVNGLVGHGLRADAEGHRIAIGSRQYLKTVESVNFSTHTDAVERLVSDGKMRVEALGTELGFDRIHAKLRTEDKAEILKALQEEGRKVAFVGDGISDAPALATTDVGIAMPRGSDVARTSADITLLDDRISAVADAQSACTQAMSVIGTNTNAALGINAALFIATSIGRMSPVAASLDHNGSTIALLLYALFATRTRAHRTPADQKS